MMNDELDAAIVFPLRLKKTYYDQGFFNVKREFDHLIRSDDGPVTIQLRGGREIKGYVNRRAQPNGTARVVGYVCLRDWFQQKYHVGDTVPIAFHTPFRLTVG